MILLLFSKHNRQLFVYYIMRTSRMRSHLEGHRLPHDANRDINNKLTYHQLLALNHDLSRENLQLKNIGNRLGSELRNLHTQFDLQPREENADLYAAINAHPVLHRLESTLLPLLDQYEKTIQDVEGRFETINQQFTALEKKYEQIVDQNDRLRAQLTDKITEVIELYKGGSEKLGGDFSQMVLQQVSEKQRLLAEENARLDRQAQRSKADAEKYSRELLECKRRLEEATSKAQKAESKHEQLSKENKYLKEEVFTVQTNHTALETQNKQLTCELERAESQLSFLNKNKEGLTKNIERLRQFCEQKENAPINYQTQNRSSIDSKRQNSSIGHAHDDDNHKKLVKLQKQYDQLLKEKNKLRDQLDQGRIPLEDANQKLADLQKRVDEAERARDRFKDSNSTNEQSFQRLRKKCMEDQETLRRQHEAETDSLKTKHQQELKAKQAIISELKNSIDETTLKMQKYKEEAESYSKIGKEDRAGKGKENERLVEQMRKKLVLSDEKMEINEKLCNDKIDIIEREFKTVKDEAEKIREESQKRNQQLRATKNDLETTRKSYQELKEQKSLLMEEINRVRGLYESSLKDKERLFDQKIKEIRMVVEESDRRRKVDKQEVEKASREYKRVLEEIRNTYEERIKVMEAELLGYSKNRRADS